MLELPFSTALYRKLSEETKQNFLRLVAVANIYDLNPSSTESISLNCHENDENIQIDSIN
jgi:hypothetical protein